MGSREMRHRLHPIPATFFLANGCNRKDGMMANNGKVLLVIKCTEDKIQYMWNDVMVYKYEK